MSETITVDEFLSSHADSVSAVAYRLRDLVQEIMPDAVEKVNTGYGNITYSTPDGVMKGLIVYIAPLKNSVNLGFADGVDLPDPTTLLQGTGKRLRHVKFKSIDEVNKVEAPVRELLHAAKAFKG